ncbi:MAG TPA: HEAT repeat domain-containing protein [Opitutaceae bacterium]
MASRPFVCLTAAALFAAAAFADDEPPMELNPSERLPTPDILPASEEGLLALKRFQLPPGFKATLWAAEPMLANPVAMNFDERGRLFVAETYRYGSSVLDIRSYMDMLEEDLASMTIEDRTALILRRFGEKGARDLAIESEIVRLLEDRDGDGTADHSAIYADGFNSPLDGIGSGVLPRRGQIWFTNIPSLWHFTGESRAEKRTELSRGYGVRFNYTGHDLHGLAWGPDGKLYYSIGDRGAHVPTKGGGIVSLRDSGAVFRCNPDGSGLEIVHRGLRNPQDLLFTENGDLFTGDNDSDQGDQERLVQVLDGGDSGWRIGYQFAPTGNAGPWNREKLWWPRHEGQAAYVVPPICNVEDGPSGITYYPGTGLAPGYEGTIFITHFKGALSRSGIQTYKLRPAGATYTVENSQRFLGNALPTDVKFGPDGRIYYSDWVEAWPKSKRGRIYAIFHPDHVNDPLTRETQGLIREGMVKRNAQELARLLGHADRRVRLETQYTLAERGAASINVLAGVATKTDGPPLARLHAIWGLGQLAGRKVPGALAPARKLLADADPEVRGQAARVLGDHGVADAVSDLVGLLQDPGNRVRYFAAQGLGKLARPDTAPALIEALRANDDHDAVLRHGLVMGLTGTRNLPALATVASDNSRAVRLGVLLAYRRLGLAEVARFLQDPDPLLVSEAARAINDEPIDAARPALAAFVGKPRADEMLMFRAINAAFRIGNPEQARALADFAARSDQPASLRSEALVQLAGWPKPHPRDRIVGVFRPLPEQTRDPAVASAALAAVLPALLSSGTPDTVQAAAFSALQALDVRAAGDELLAAVSDPSKTAVARTAALEALDNFNDPRLAQAVEAAGSSDSPALRLAALPIAARLSPESALPVLTNLVERGNIEEKRTAFRALADLAHPEADRLLASQLRELAEGNVPVAAQLELLQSAGERDDPATKELLQVREAALATSPDPLAQFRVALEGGNRGMGQRVFNNHPVLACQRCHQVGGQGGEAGPDLSLIGTKHSREMLLEAIIKPSSTIAEGFDTVVVTLKSGDVQVGTIAAEDASTLTIRLGDGTTAAIAKNTIQSRQAAPSSMPEIYGSVLTKSEVRDLLEFLATLNVDPGKASGPRALQPFPQEFSAAGHGE